MTYHNPFRPTHQDNLGSNHTNWLPVCKAHFYTVCSLRDTVRYLEAKKFTENIEQSSSKSLYIIEYTSSWKLFNDWHKEGISSVNKCIEYMYYNILPLTQMTGFFYMILIWYATKSSTFTPNKIRKSINDVIQLFFCWLEIIISFVRDRMMSLKLPHSSSSDPSKQSARPSHRRETSTHWLFLHRNSASEQLRKYLSINLKWVILHVFI